MSEQVRRNTISLGPGRIRQQSSVFRFLGSSLLRRLSRQHDAHQADDTTSLYQAPHCRRRCTRGRPDQPPLRGGRSSPDGGPTVADAAAAVAAAESVPTRAGQAASTHRFHRSGLRLHRRHRQCPPPLPLPLPHAGQANPDLARRGAAGTGGRSGVSAPRAHREWGRAQRGRQEGEGGGEGAWGIAMLALSQAHAAGAGQQGMLRIRWVGR
jgi:hypothetical protein